MARRMLRIGFALLILLGLLNASGCSTETAVIPVSVTEAWRQPLQVSTIYTVQPGDSLYSIAWMYGLDYRQVAKDNNIKPSHHVQVDQQLRLIPAAPALANYNNKVVVTSVPITKMLGSVVTTKNQTVVSAPEETNSATATTAPKAVMQSAPPATAPVVATPTPLMGTTIHVAGITWTWPTQGQIINNFAPTTLNRGVDIAGKLGNPVVAAAAGKIVYAGNGLRGYGQLIIIKHTDEYLSAYAHNQKLLVKEGQTVRLGQQIATLGATEAKNPALHFEIRKNGKPVDPLKYLPTR